MCWEMEGQECGQSKIVFFLIKPASHYPLCYSEAIIFDMGK